MKTSQLRNSYLGLMFLFLHVYGLADHRTLPTSTDSPILQLKALIEEALSKNAELRAEKAATEASKAQVGPQGSYDDPILAFEAMNYPVGTLSTREYEMTGNQISLSQKIPFPGKLGKKREAAEFDSKAQENVLRGKEIETIKNVRLSYYELFLSYRKLDTLNEQKGVLEQLTTVTRNNYVVGRVPQAEVLNLQVETANTIDKTLEIERKIKDLLGELNHLLGRADHSQFLYGRTEPLAPVAFDFASYPERKIYDLALSKSPAITAKLATKSASESRLSFAKRGYLPDFDFKVGYTLREAGGMNDGKDFVSGMVGISIPLWFANKQSEEVRGAIAEKLRAEALLDEEKNKLAHRIHVTYAALEESAKRIKLYEAGILPLIRQAVASARSAYLARKLEYPTLLGSINRRFEMEVAYAEALATYHSNIAELEFVTGQSLAQNPGDAP